MEIPTPTKPAVIVRILGICWKIVLGLKPRNKFIAERERKEEEGFKLTAPAPQGQGCRGEAKLDPPALAKFENRFEQIVKTLKSCAMSNETKQRILKKAVSQCPSITMEFLGLKVPSLLDSGSMLMLIREAYFNKYILPLLRGRRKNWPKHIRCFAFQPPIIRNAGHEVFEADVSILRFRITSVGVLVVRI